MSNNVGHRDVLYLFACHFEWQSKRNLAAYEELLAALGDRDCDIRTIAEVLLERDSPRRELTETTLESW